MSETKEERSTKRQNTEVLDEDEDQRPQEESELVIREPVVVVQVS
jgi:hypothetical protein